MQKNPERMQAMIKDFMAEKEIEKLAKKEEKEWQKY